MKFLICARQLLYLILPSHTTSEGRYHDPYFIAEDTQAQRGGDTFSKVTKQATELVELNLNLNHRYFVPQMPLLWAASGAQEVLRSALWAMG